MFVIRLMIVQESCSNARDFAGTGIIPRAYIWTGRKLGKFKLRKEGGIVSFADLRRMIL